VPRTRRVTAAKRESLPGCRHVITNVTQYTQTYTQTILVLQLASGSPPLSAWTVTHPCHRSSNTAAGGRSMHAPRGSVRAAAANAYIRDTPHLPEKDTFDMHVKLYRGIRLLA